MSEELDRMKQEQRELRGPYEERVARALEALNAEPAIRLTMEQMRMVLDEEN